MADTNTDDARVDAARRVLDPAAALAPLRRLVTVERINGIPLVFAPRAGRTRAGIVFRVGWADEPLARSGITHLIEHLALCGMSETSVAHNGTTRELTTHFHAEGSPAEIATFLAGVTSALRNGLPWARLDGEKSILRSEEASVHSWNAIARQRVERHGARDRGLLGFGAAALDAITRSDIQAWISRYFTKENAVVWIAGERVPNGLDLDLPAGGLWASPPPTTSILPSTPAVFRGADGVVIIDALVPHSPAASVFARLATRLLVRSLRNEAALSYAASCNIDRVDADTARLTIVADAPSDQGSEVISRVFSVLTRMRSGDVAAPDLEAATTGDDIDLRPADLADALPDLVSAVVSGIEILHPADSARGRREVQIDEVQRVAEQFFDTALAQSPTGDVTDPDFRHLTPSSEEAVFGRMHRRIGVPETALYTASDGISAKERGHIVTVLFDECVMIERWPDGARRLTGADGFQLTIEPTLFSDVTPDLIAAIDASADSDVVVDRPPRASADIPSPPIVAPEGATDAKSPPRRKYGFAIAATAFLLLFLLGLGLTFNDALHIDAPRPDGTFVSGTTIVGGMVTCAVLAVVSGALFAAYRFRNRHRRSSEE